MLDVLKYSAIAISQKWGRKPGAPTGKALVCNTKTRGFYSFPRLPLSAHSVISTSDRQSFFRKLLGITAIGVGIFFLTGGLQDNTHPNTRAACIAGLFTGASIATYTIWDKYAVSVVHISPILLDFSPTQSRLCS